ncbi:hypothetical protein V5E38_19095 [Rossellomorea sp. GAMAL-10_SWC]
MKMREASGHKWTNATRQSIKMESEYPRVEINEHPFFKQQTNIDYLPQFKLKE